MWTCLSVKFKLLSILVPACALQDDPKLDNYNVGDKIRRFLRTAEWWAEPYGTKHTLMTMGLWSFILHGCRYSINF